MRRDDALVYLPALMAALMLAQGHAAAMPLQAVLCSGGSAEFPGKAPGGDCDKACHANCSRRKGRI